MEAGLVVLNGRVRTMDPRRPEARAVAVLGGRIALVGSEEEARDLAGPATQVLDAEGGLVLPGFNDAHVHFLQGGVQLAGVQLRDARSPQELAERLGRFAAGQPPESWILNGLWDHEGWPGAPLPTRELIDAVTPRNPVFVCRLDCHMGLANSLALRLAGVTRDTADAPGGLILRGADGEPTGILKDAAMGLVYRVVPPMSPPEIADALRAATDHAASLGVTSVQSMDPLSDHLAALQDLRAAGVLKTRVYGALPLAHSAALLQVGLRTPFGDEVLRLGLLKAFSDGSLGSKTAWFYEPYTDDPSTCGLAGEEMEPEGAMLERVRVADRAGLQVAIHAIGDRANAEVLSLFEEAALDDPSSDRRSRVEHAQHLRSQDIARFARRGVVASVQPSHAIDDGRWAKSTLGPERCLTSYPWRSLLDAGARLALGTDWPVASLDPLLGLYAAVTRRTTDGRHPGGWIPEQAITLEEAVRAYTAGSAYAEFQEAVKGTLAPGMLADLVVLSQDLFACPPEAIPEAHVHATVMGGEVVYRR
ncbi:MAG TPA: amidohydrolase [Armatimonadota bacterium]|jgi:hypothetical protein